MHYVFSIITRCNNTYQWILFFQPYHFLFTILKIVFFKSQEEAEALMLKVHQQQSATAGVYSYDVAQSKAQKATQMAREEGFPLRLTVEPEDN